MQSSRTTIEQYVLRTYSYYYYCTAINPRRGQRPSDDGRRASMIPPLRAKTWHDKNEPYLILLHAIVSQFFARTHYIVPPC